jgi:hemerythrin-like metal-binding protein
MAFIDWTDSLSVSVERFDAQHKRLVALINELHAGMRARKGKEAVDKVLDGLVEYTKTHFAAEEAAFDTYGYPEAPAHKKEHADLVAKVADLHEKHHSGALFVSVEVLDFLAAWLKNHIQESDKRYGPFLAGKVR